MHHAYLVMVYHTLPTAVVDQVVNKGTMSLLFSGELESDHYDALLAS
jgi:hypothetical protein